VLHGGELPRPHRRGPEIADLAGLDDVVQRLHRLLDRRVRIEAVDLVEIDVVGTEPGQRCVDLLHHGSPGEPSTAGSVAHRLEELRREHDVITTGVRLEGAAHDLLGAAVPVDVGGVPEGDAELDRLSEDRLPCLVAQGPRHPGTVAEAHAPQSDPADLQPRRPELYLLHNAVLSFG